MNTTTATEFPATLVLEGEGNVENEVLYVTLDRRFFVAEVGADELCGDTTFAFCEREGSEFRWIDFKMSLEKACRAADMCAMAGKALTCERA